jgi:hypothetical protein
VPQLPRIDTTPRIDSTKLNEELCKALPQYNVAKRNDKLTAPIKKVEMLPPIVKQNTNNRRPPYIQQKQLGGGFKVESLEPNRNETTKQKLKHSPSKPSPIPHKDKVSKITGGGFKMK